MTKLENRYLPHGRTISTELVDTIDKARDRAMILATFLTCDSLTYNRVKKVEALLIQARSLMS